MLSIRPAMIRPLVPAMFVWLSSHGMPANATEYIRADTGTVPVAPAESRLSPVPDPSLTADRVISTQMQALQHNDASDQGIAITFRFASPANKRQTGPLSRFTQMLKNPPYDAMLNAQEVRYGELLVDDDRARQEVTVISAGGMETTYVFFMTRQQAPPYTNCWMTEAVTIKRVVNQLEAWG